MFVIGNGESRKHVNLNNIQAIKIGCNALMRDHTVDHLVCVDRKMVQEAISCGYNLKSKIYTRQDWIGQFSNSKNITVVPELPYSGQQRCDEPFHWGSGPYAVLLAAQLCRDLGTDEKVHLLGFDLYGNKDNKVNNVYKGTKNYDLESKRAVDPRYWIYQIAKVFEHYDDINFVVHNKREWTTPESWKKLNVSFDIIENLFYNNVTQLEAKCSKIPQSKMLSEKH